jgi:hypothetical protein
MNSENSQKHDKASFEDINKFKKRMLEWANPVEFVNNMYGSHPDDRNQDYFRKVFSK